MKSARVVGASTFLVGIAAVVVACSSSSRGSGFESGDADGGTGANGGEGGAVGTGFGPGTVDGGTGGCTGIGCDVVPCGATPTTITGQVFDPAGKNPLYNVIVYIPTDPNAALPALSQGASCDKCGATALNPVTSTLTDEDGKFTLTNVPYSKGVPVVVQVGKWRKKVTIDVDTKCGENKLPAPLTLPKNASEGDMPQIAVTTGAYDTLECLFVGMGIDQKEFVQGADPSGHVHLFKGDGGSTGVDANANLWSDQAKLGLYDLVALSCEGSPITSNKSNISALEAYANAGGRVFATHYQYVWFVNGSANFKSVATWTPDAVDFSGPTYNVEQGFPKGKSFALWLQNVGASTTLGKIPLNSVAADLTGVNTATSQSWIDVSSSKVKYFSFNAPVTAMPQDQCGRVVYSDLHVSGMGGESFPSGCNPKPGADLTPQQKALEFMLFDLSSCVQSDSTPPSPPK